MPKTTIIKTLMFAFIFTVCVISCGENGNTHIQEGLGKIVIDGNTFSIGDTLENYPGIIYEQSIDVYLIKAGIDGYPFQPDSLPQHFRVDGMQVRFTGIPQPIPPNVRLMGRPLLLIEITKESNN